MFSEYERFAIYWVPRVGSGLAEFGRTWTGWCAETGNPTTDRNANGLEPGGLGVPWDIALHGLHGVICGPFHPAPGRSHWRLEKALAEVARTMPAVPLPPLEVTVRMGQVVLAPSRQSEGLLRLQGRVIDAVRLVRMSPYWPLPDTPDAISLPGDSVHGRPLVDNFVLPLTDPMDACVAYDLAADLYHRLQALLKERHMLMDLALMADPGEGRPWRLIERYQLSEEPMAAMARVPQGMSCPGENQMPPLNDMLGSDWDTVIA